MMDALAAAEPVPVSVATGLSPANALDQIAVVGDRFLLRLPANARLTSSRLEVLVNWTAR